MILEQLPSLFPSVCLEIGTVRAVHTRVLKLYSHPRAKEFSMQYSAHSSRVGIPSRWNRPLVGCFALLSSQQNPSLKPVEILLINGFDYKSLEITTQGLMNSQKAHEY